MRCATVGQILGRRGGGSTQRAPRAGSGLRKVYDLFQANKGMPVAFQIGDYGTGPNTISMLTDFYGLDIRRLHNGSSRVGRRSQWILAGEWFGRVYVDYVAERAQY